MSKSFRRTFSEEERQKYVTEVLESGSNNLIALKYDLNPILLSKWVCNYRRYNQTLQPKDKTEKEYIPDYKKAYIKAQKELKDKELELQILRDLVKKTQI